MGSQRGYKIPQNARTRPTADRHDEEWTNQEDERLLALKTGGMKLEDVALELGRTFSATSGRHSALTSGRVSGAHRRQIRLMHRKPNQPRCADNAKTSSGRCLACFNFHRSLP